MSKREQDISTANEGINELNKNSVGLVNTKAFSQDSDQQSLSSEEFESKYFIIDARNKDSIPNEVKASVLEEEDESQEWQDDESHKSRNKSHQKRRSPVYKHFKDVVLANGTHKLQCKWCSDMISVIFSMILSLSERF